MNKIFIILFSLFSSLYLLASPPTDVFITHGFMGDGSLHTPNFSPVTRELENAGHKVHIAFTPRINTIEDSAAIGLRQLLENIPPGREFDLIGHSQGGLVSRVMAHMFMNLSEEEKAGRSLRRVGSIGTPHRGSGKSIPGINKTTLDMAKPILPKSIHNFFNTAYEMDNKEMIAFNQKYPNIDGVIYFSITNQQRSPLPRIIPTATKKEMTDGLIAGESSRWGVEIKIDGDHPRGNHINQVYSVAGKDKAATDNGLAIVEFLKQTAHGEAPKDGVFHYQVPENIQYRSPSKYNQMKFMLNCLTK